MRTELRLSEFIASLSLATDLGLGVPMEHVLRQTLIADRLADAAGLAAAGRANCLHLSLLAWVGCVADSHEMAQWYGDDLALRAASYDIDKVGLPMLRFLLGRLTHDGAWGRLTTLGRFFGAGLRDASRSLVTHCQTTGDIAARLGLDPAVRTALGQAFERWDGKGVPRGLRGEQVAITTRVVQIADDAEVMHRRAGRAAALRMLRQRRGTEFDPTLVDICLDRPDEVFADVDVPDAWQRVVDRCGAADRWIAEHELDDVLTVVADYADLKSVWWLGHSRAVAALVRAAAPAMGLSPAAATLARRAALVHRIGAVGVPTNIWNKPGELTPAERVRARQVPPLSRTVLSRQPVLAELGRIAGMVRERLDGSGYPAGITGESIPVESRLVAAAQLHQALSESRPHRPALDARARAAELQQQVRSGLLDAGAVRAVLTAAGHRVHRRAPAVAGLTARECQVLELLVRGASNREVARRLSISPRTVGSHVEHIYTKIGVSTRGAAAMFAMRHGLVGPE